MSGVAVPPVIYQPFAIDATSGFITNPIPQDASATPGKASYAEGFPPATMTNPTAGGVPPSGADMNGILFALSSWCAALQAGQWTAFNSTVATEITGYALGAVVRSGIYSYTNNLAGNTDDPSSSLANWIRNIPARSAVALSGAQNNYVLPGPSDYFLDVDSGGGAVDFSGFIAQRDGQRITITNRGANLINILALSGSSTSARQVRAPSDLTIVQNQSISLTYNLGDTKWLVA